MLKIEYPEPDFKIKRVDERELIFDTLRKRWVTLTPEEWVRQNFVRYLVQDRNYPPSLIAMEKTIRLGELKKRFDILVYDLQHQPWMMIECKSAAIPLNETVLQQLLRYHISIPTGFLLITNGTYTYGWEKRGSQLQSIERFPVL